MKKTVTAFAIYATILGKKKFIADVSRTPANKIIPVGYTEKEDEAHTWNDEAAVTKAMGNIHNPQDRVFNYEKINVLQGNKPHFRSANENLEA